ncbi:MAG: YggT family protein [Spirochaetaceae bacterium]|jgi:YggT family protein|nr:YggT family protein [Spirochaetaceae bacterium]
MAFTPIFKVLSAAISIYSTLVFIRIILTWFPGVNFGRPYRILSHITDPFIYMFSGLRFFRVGNMDFSPIAAFVLLAIAGNIAMVLADLGRVSVPVVAYIGISTIATAFSFLFGLFSVITGLRLVAYIINADTYYSPFWRAIDMVSAPVIYKVTRVFFPRRVVKYKTSLVVSMAALAGTLAALQAITHFAGLLLRL